MVGDTCSLAVKGYMVLMKPCRTDQLQSRRLVAWKASSSSPLDERRAKPSLEHPSLTIDAVLAGLFTASGLPSQLHQVPAESSRPGKIAAKAGLEKLRVGFRKAFPVDLSFLF